MSPDSTNSAVYNLKTVVLVRLAAETTALVILGVLPALLWLAGIFVRLSPITQALLIAVAVISLLVVPAYGFVTFRVVVDEMGLRTISLFRKQSIEWQKITGLRLRTTFGRHYVVLSEFEELSFPAALINVNELVDRIRTRLPQGGRLIAQSGAKIFARHKLGAIALVLSSSLSLMFVVLLWFFAGSLQKGLTGARPADPSDAYIMLGFALVFTLGLLVRAGVILVMPYLVSTNESGIKLQAPLKSVEMPWDELRSLKPTLFFLPEGLHLKSKSGQFILGCELEAYDELEDELRQHMAKDGAS